MRSKEKFVDTSSYYYFYTPSTRAKKLFFSPLIIGKFRYLPGYRIQRSCFDNYLLMLVTDGRCLIETNGRHFEAVKGNAVLLDCHKPHAYGSEDGWEAVWLHFGGPLATAYADHIGKVCGIVSVPPNFTEILRETEDILQLFRGGREISEPAVSTQITSILNLLLAGEAADSSPAKTAVQNTAAYINRHFAEPLTLAQLADRVSLSRFYFTRIFAKETGQTPYQYLYSTRLSYARYLLKTSGTSTKEIAFRCGFSSESSFCSAFRKKEGMSPGEYRRSERSRM